jgi:hypothetical protein
MIEENERVAVANDTDPEKIWRHYFTKIEVVNGTEGLGTGNEDAPINAFPASVEGKVENAIELD